MHPGRCVAFALLFASSAGAEPAAIGAWDARTGQELWVQPLEGPGDGFLELHPGALIVGDVFFDPATGERVAMPSLLGAPLAQSSSGELRHDGKLYALTGPPSAPAGPPKPPSPDEPGKKKGDGCDCRTAGAPGAPSPLAPLVLLAFLRRSTRRIRTATRARTLAGRRPRCSSQA